MQFYCIQKNSSYAFLSADSAPNRTQNLHAANAPAPASCSVLGGWRKEFPLGEKTRIPSHQQEIGRKAGRGNLEGEDMPGTVRGPGPPRAHTCRADGALSGVESTPSFLTTLPPLCKSTLVVGSAGQELGI